MTGRSDASRFSSSLAFLVLDVLTFLSRSFSIYIAIGPEGGIWWRLLLYSPPPISSSALETTPDRPASLVTVSSISTLHPLMIWLWMSRLRWFERYKGIHPFRLSSVDPSSRALTLENLRAWNWTHWPSWRNGNGRSFCWRHLPPRRFLTVLEVRRSRVAGASPTR